MKKSIIALAVAAALATPLAAQADTILYGSARVSVDYNDEDNIANRFKGDGYWDVVNNDSRLGVLGSEDLGGGLSAIYQYEFGVDVTEGGNFESNRPKFVGLKGGFGSITLGTQETPYYQVAGITDIFNSSKTFGPTAWLGGSFNGYKLNPSFSERDASSLTRLDNTILYTTPDLNGFSASAMLSMSNSLVGFNEVTKAGTFPIVANEAGGWSDDVDIWNVSAKYSNGPFFAGISYIALNGSSDRYSNVDLDLDQWVLGLGYSSGPFSVGFIYEQGTYNEWGLYKPTWTAPIKKKGFGLEADDPWNAYLVASYTFGNNVISAAYGQLDPGISKVDDIQNYILGYQYNLSKRTRLWVEYIGRAADSASLNKDGNIIVAKPGTIWYGDANVVSIGTRVDF